MMTSAKKKLVGDGEATKKKADHLATEQESYDHCQLFIVFVV